MRTFIFGLIFGLLAVVHSSPVTNVTQMLDKAEDDIRQAETDGFLINFPRLTTESPKKNTTVPASQQTSTVSGEKDFEGSASGESSDLFPLHVSEHFTTTTTSAAPQQTSTVLGVKDFEGSASGDLFPSQKGETSTTTPSQTSPFPGLKDFEGSASGDLFPSQEGEYFTTTTDPGEKASEDSAPEESNDLDQVYSTTPPTLAAPVGPRGSRMFGMNEDSASKADSTNDIVKTENNPASVDTVHKNVISNNAETQKGATETHKGHTTPGWIIIVAFIVGLAALIMICVAIATRDKWNRPSQATPLDNNTNSTNQAREQEMETFLPKENGKSAEYTVIPLDELPEKHLSD